MLWSKGLGEVVEAIGKVKQNENNTTLYVAGILDDKDPDRIELDQILQWEKEGKIIWLGRRDDIQNLIRNSHVVILPTKYSEGVPRIIIEACAMGRSCIASRIQPGSDVIVCAEMDEQWGYVGAKSRQRWLFYAYDRLRKTVVAHVFGERTMATLGRLMSLLSPFDVVIWMTDGWPLHESRLKGKLHVISKRYTQRIERHNLNLRQHPARLGRKSLSFSKSVELHDKVIGHYLNIKHYQ